MKYKLYTTSHSAWDGMFQAIKLAKKSVYIEMFIFLNDTSTTHNFLKLLEEKAKAGLEVVIIADAYGSWSLRNKEVLEMRAAGVEFIYFSHWIKRTHRKILLVDNKIAFLGGVNISEKIRNWSDLQIRLEGRIVSPILKSFAYNYERVGGKKESILKYSQQPITKKIKAWIIDNLVNTNKLYYLNNYYRDKISGAKESIQIVTPYLLPPRWLIAVLDDACRRGVKIEIIIPNDTDVKGLNKVNYLNCCRLSALGVNFFLTPNMNHAKIMIIDGREGVIGSQNMDIVSFGLCAEAGVFFEQKDLVHDLRKIVDKWRDESLRFGAKALKIKWYDKILIGFFKFFYPLF